VPPLELEAGAPPKRKRRSVPLPDEEWLAMLCADPAYEGVDVRRQTARARVWFAERKRPLTRAALLSWLNRERPISPPPPPPDIPGVRHFGPDA
jgi:hypothetical protein